MLPPMLPPTNDNHVGPSYAGVYSSAPHQDVLTFLQEVRFSGWVGPAQGDWVVIVAENPLGRTAGDKRTVAELARELAERSSGVALAAQVEKDQRLRLWLHSGSRAVSSIDTNPPEDHHGFAFDEFGEPVPGDDAGFEPVLDEFGEPVGAMSFGQDDDEFEHGAFAAALGRPEAAEEVTELLQELLSEDQSESERLTALARLLGLPTWLVATPSLPKKLSIGPDKSSLTRLQAGKRGASGWVKGALTRKVRGTPSSAG